MASLTGPIKLTQVAKLQKNPVFKGVIQNIIRESKVLDYISFENVDSLDVVAVRWIKLPETKFRRINAGYEKVSGDVDHVYESVYAFGADMQMDRVYEKLGNYIKDPRQENIEMITKAAAYKFKDYLINGDHGTDPDGFEGMKKRISNMSSRQHINLAPGSDSAYDPKASAANALNFVDKWEEANYKANEGDVQMILLNEKMYWGFTRVLRFAGIDYSGMMDVTTDQFDRNIVTYKGTPFIDMGWQIDQVTEVITNTEVVGDAGADGTSVYFVPVNMEQGIQGIQLDNLEVYDPLGGSEMETLPSKLMRLEWWCGIAGFGSYGPTRLSGIKDPALWT